MQYIEKESHIYNFNHPKKTPLMIMLCGLPGSGKSTYADSIRCNGERPIIHSSDEMRKKLYNDESCQEDNAKVFQRLHKEIKEDLISGKDVVYDATNISKKKRMAFLESIRNINCENICVVIATTLEACLFNNRCRSRVVPEEAIKRMYRSWTPPHFSEGFTRIIYHFSYLDQDKIVQYDSSKQYVASNYFKTANSYDQENEHHSLSLGDHITKAGEYIQEKEPDNINLLIAALLHDIGKLYTKTRTNHRGEFDGNCHYYQHESVGSYEGMFLLHTAGNFFDDEITHIVNLIYYHMHPYMSWKQSRKARERDRAILGEEMFNEIMILHDADLYAH